MLLQRFKTADGGHVDRIRRINLLRIRKTFIGYSIIMFGILFSVGIFVWFALPEITATVKMTRSRLEYDLFYRRLLAIGTAKTPPSKKSAVSIPVLLYHGEGSASNMPLSVFVDQLRTLKQNGWNTVTIKQFEDFISGKISLPDKSFLLTFDDGRKDTYYQADPVIDDLGYTAVMYVITGYSMPQSGVKSYFYLSPSELSIMLRSGRWELQSHGDQDHGTYDVQSTLDLSQEASTVSGHFLSDKFWSSQANRFETDSEFSDRVTADLIFAKRALENNFNITVDTYAYPFNDFGEDSINFPASRQILDQIIPKIYLYAMYQTWNGNGDSFDYPGENNGPGDSTYMIKRIEPEASWSGSKLLTILDEGRAKALPYESSSFSDDWVVAWGVSQGGAPLTLSASAKTTGSAVFLNGSGAWRNYKFTASFSRSTQMAVSLIARNINGENYAVCAFTDKFIELEARTPSGRTVISRKNMDIPLSAEGSISVSGGEGSCYLNGKEIITAALPSYVPSVGGIGIQVWGGGPGMAKAAVSKVGVSAL